MSPTDYMWAGNSHGVRNWTEVNGRRLGSIVHLAHSSGVAYFDLKEERVKVHRKTGKYE